MSSSCCTLYVRNTGVHRTNNIRASTCTQRHITTSWAEKCQGFVYHSIQTSHSVLLYVVLYAQSKCHTYQNLKHAKYEFREDFSRLQLTFSVVFSSIYKHASSLVYFSTPTCLQVGRPTQISPEKHANKMYKTKNTCQRPPRPTNARPLSGGATASHILFLRRGRGVFDQHGINEIPEQVPNEIPNKVPPKYRRITEWHIKRSTKRSAERNTEQSAETMYRPTYQTKPRRNTERKTESSTEQNTERTCCIPTRGWSRRSSPSLPRPSRRWSREPWRKGTCSRTRP